jgi:hypothetical protein
MLVQHLLEFSKELNMLILLHTVSVKKPKCIIFVHLACHNYILFNNEPKQVRYILDLNNLKHCMSAYSSNNEPEYIYFQ